MSDEIKKEKPAKPVNEPNIVFTRKVESKGGMVDADAPAFIMLPFGEKIDLPKDQSKPFYHERAADIIRASKHYKEFKPKGK